jgi:hypothetical protein
MKTGQIYLGDTIADMLQRKSKDVTALVKQHAHNFREMFSRGPLSLVSIIEELLGSKSGSSGLENQDYGPRDPLRWPRDTLYPQKVGTTFSDERWSLGRCSSLQATELVFRSLNHKWLRMVGR